MSKLSPSTKTRGIGRTGISFSQGSLFLRRELVYKETTAYNGVDNGDDVIVADLLSIVVDE